MFEAVDGIADVFERVSHGQGAVLLAFDVPQRLGDSFAGVANGQLDLSAALRV
jgi:hypothetical protein